MLFIQLALSRDFGKFLCEVVNESVVMQPRDRKAGRRADLVRNAGRYTVTQLPVRVVQEAKRGPLSLEEVMDKIDDLRKDWVDTFQHRRAYAALCNRRDRMMKERKRA